MRISELIDELELAMDEYGDLPIYSIEEKINYCNIKPLYNGRFNTIKKPNQLFIEFDVTV